MSREAIDAIRAVRLAAHELANACAVITGGTEMAIAVTTVDTVGEPLNGLSPRPLEKIRRDRKEDGT